MRCCVSYLTAPPVESLAVGAVGVTWLRSAFPTDEVSGIVVAYMAGIRGTFSIVVAGAGFFFVPSLLDI